MATNDKLYSMLSLAQKAGALCLGWHTMARYLTKKKGSLLILANDAGETTKKRILELSLRYEVPLMEWGQKREFAKIFNRPVAAVLLTNKDFVHPFYQEGGNLKS